MPIFFISAIGTSQKEANRKVYGEIKDCTIV